VTEQIDRPEDPRISPYAHIGDHAWLREHGFFVAEGRLLAQRLIAEWPSSIHSLLVSPTASAALQGAVPPDLPVYVANPSVLQGVTGINFHRGCLALGRRPQPLEPEAFAGARRLVALEAIANPDNVGGIFRVAAAFGIEGILLDRNTADPLYRKAIRTSMGSIFSVPFARINDWPLGLRGIAACGGLEIVATTTRRQATPLSVFAQGSHHRLIVMLGSEGTGLSDAALRLANHEVTIPTRTAVDSLNVVVAAGIALATLSDRDSR
jgi:tRNA G18 (ribose-2'-O)-methylase SpoU